MKIRNIIIISTAIVVFAVYAISCDILNSTSDEDCEYPDYSDCMTDEPREPYLHIKLTVNEQNPKVKISMYEGNLGEDTAIYTIETDTSYYELGVYFDERYTITAQYLSGEDTIIAIDNTKITKSTYTNCDSTCWQIYGREVDLTLARQK